MWNSENKSDYRRHIKLAKENFCQVLFCKKYTWSFFKIPFPSIRFNLWCSKIFPGNFRHTLRGVAGPRSFFCKNDRPSRETDKVWYLSSFDKQMIFVFNYNLLLTRELFIPSFIFPVESVARVVLLVLIIIIIIMK